jgi:hypothetical protein
VQDRDVICHDRPVNQVRVRGDGENSHAFLSDATAAFGEAPDQAYGRIECAANIARSVWVSFVKIIDDRMEVFESA